MRWLLQIPPWLVGLLITAVLTWFIIAPVIVREMHERLPVYSTVTNQEVERHGNFVRFRGEFTKHHDCDVIVGRGFVAIEWQEALSRNRRVLNLLDDTGQLAMLGPVYQAGHAGTLRWFAFDLSVVAERDGVDKFELLIPCRRWGYDVVASISGWVLPPAQYRGRQE
jgi:hypothetical protein